VGGPAGAGKTSLLACFERTSALLGGQVIERNRAGDDAAVNRLRRHLRFQPSVGGDRKSIDFDVEEIDGWKALEAPADAMVATVDASAPDRDKALDELGKTLRRLEEQRSAEMDVGELPVFIVLTKCDVLAKTGESELNWMERLEELKRLADGRLARKSDGPQTDGFGSLAKHIWCTASHRPAPRAGQAETSYGVAELLRQCLLDAEGYRKRSRHSAQRLSWTSAATLLGVLSLVALVLGFWSARGRVSELANRIAIIRLSAANEGAWFREPLERKLRALQGFKEDPEFNRLNEEDRAFVAESIGEIQAYIDYKEGLLRVRVPDFRTKEDLDRLVKELVSGPLALPARFAERWFNTDAGRLHAGLLKDIASLRKAIAWSVDWYAGQVQEAEKLRGFVSGKPSETTSWARWRAHVRQATSARFPHEISEELPGADSLTYITALQMAEVMRMQRSWLIARVRLQQLAQLIEALGFGGKRTDGRQWALEIPEGFSAAAAGQILDDVRKAFPELAREKTRIEIPEAIAPQIDAALEQDYRRLIEAGRAVVRKHFRELNGNGPETRAGWRRLLAYLAKPDDLAGWSSLTMLVLRLRNQDSADPVTALTSFIGRDDFVVDVESVIVSIPANRQITPAGPFTIALRHEGTSDGITMALVDPAKEEKGLARYQFNRQSGGELRVHPADSLTATLSVKRAGDPGEWVLSWDQSRSRVYAFDGLAEPPRLRRPQIASGGESMADVTISVEPAEGLPRLPDLFPTIP
jgi:hypothetical protein